MIQTPNEMVFWKQMEEDKKDKENAGFQPPGWLHGV